MGEKKRKKTSKQKKKKEPNKQDSHFWIGQGHLYQPENPSVRKEL